MASSVIKNSGIIYQTIAVANVSFDKWISIDNAFLNCRAINFYLSRFGYGGSVCISMNDLKEGLLATGTKIQPIKDESSYIWFQTLADANNVKVYLSSSKSTSTVPANIGIVGFL